MKLTEIINKILVDNDINQIFSVCGGFAMFINNDLSNDNFNITYHHHTTCGYAAIGYCKTKLKSCVVSTTAGCGITNTVSCINSAWQDNVL